MAEAELMKSDPLSTEKMQPSPLTVPAEPWISRIEQHDLWPTLSQLQMTMTASVVLNGFKVRDLLQLKIDQVIESAWPETEDVQLHVGQVQVGWSEFEVVDQSLAVRVTRLA